MGKMSDEAIRREEAQRPVCRCGGPLPSGWALCLTCDTRRRLRNGCLLSAGVIRDGERRQRPPHAAYRALPQLERRDRDSPDSRDSGDSGDSRPVSIRFTESVTVYTFAIGRDGRLKWAWPWAHSAGYPFWVRVGAGLRGRRRR